MREVLFLVVGIVLASVVFLGFNNHAKAPSGQQVAAVSATTTEIQETSGDIPQEKTYRVLKVVDGDTLALKIEGKSVTVRLIGLDTPETSDARTGVQCFGREASEKAKAILTGTSVSIETDPTQDTYDRYGRLLAYIYLHDGTLFNEYMIAEGYGHEYTYNTPYKYQAEFKAAEKEARENKRGLWDPRACALGTDERKTSSQKYKGPSLIIPNGNYECSRNTYNCTNFKTQGEAQYVFELCGSSANDVHKLDSDKDGVVCESLP